MDRTKLLDDAHVVHPANDSNLVARREALHSNNNNNSEVASSFELARDGETPKGSLQVSGRAVGNKRRRSPWSKCFRNGYLVYCFTCLTLTLLLMILAVWEAAMPQDESRFWHRKLRPEEEAVEAFVGAAMCMETALMLHLVGRKHFLRDPWRVLDTIVAGLTFICGIFFLFRRHIHEAEIVEEIDKPVLALRFALQPCRMVATGFMVARARKRTAPEDPEPLTPLDPRLPCEGLARPILSSDLALQVREMLPIHLRFSQWELVYSPAVHGTSLTTFYRQQEGPNVIVIRDAQGGIFGGFATNSWQPTNGSYGLPEAFVFTVRPPDSGAKASVPTAVPPVAAPQAPVASPDEAAGPEPLTPYSNMDDGPLELPTKAVTPASSSSNSNGAEPEPLLDFFWAVPKVGRLIQWSDQKMLGLGYALTVHDDFLRGQSSECPTFCSRPLSLAGKEFVIRDFECWRVGVSDNDV